MIRRLTLMITLAVLILPALLLTGCAAQKDGSMGEMNMDGIKMASMANMPAEVKDASATTQQAYQFAVANPEVTQAIPCYCGCGAMGHTSNYACYVKEAEGDQITYDQHALGCSICVDITQDAMRMTGEGQSIEDIRAYVDQTYGKYGPSNMP